jgi:hypothetical protein
MDTKYLQRAFEEWMDSDFSKLAKTKTGDLSVFELSLLLRRAQELKDADQKAACTCGSGWKDTCVIHGYLIKPGGKL